MKPHCWCCGKFTQKANKFTGYNIHYCNTHNDRLVFKRHLHACSYGHPKYKKQIMRYIEEFRKHTTAVYLFPFSGQSTGKDLHKP